MGRINLGRVVLGGIAAGIVLDLCEGLMRGVLLRDQGADMMAALGLPSAVTTKQLVAFNVWGLVVGVCTVLLYAAIRPRIGAGPKTAIVAALFVWALVFALGAMPFVFMHMVPVRFGAMTACAEAVMMIIAGLVGGALYKEATEAPRGTQEQPTYAATAAGRRVE
jgi:hypothetical protein